MAVCIRNAKPLSAPAEPRNLWQDDEGIEEILQIEVDPETFVDSDAEDELNPGYAERNAYINNYNAYRVTFHHCTLLQILGISAV
jgi:hypothetical protein